MITSKQESLLDKARKAVRRYADGIKSPSDRNRQMAYEDALVNWILGQVSDVETHVSQMKVLVGAVIAWEDKIADCTCPNECPPCAASMRLQDALSAYVAAQKGAPTVPDAEPRESHYKDLLQRAKKIIYDDHMESLSSPSDGVEEAVREGPVADLLNEIQEALKEQVATVSIYRPSEDGSLGFLGEFQEPIDWKTLAERYGFGRFVIPRSSPGGILKIVETEIGPESQKDQKANSQSRVVESPSSDHTCSRCGAEWPGTKDDCSDCGTE